VAVLGEAHALLQQIVAVPDFAAVLGAPAGGPTTPQDRITSYCHPAGTCRIGTAGDRHAVVDGRGAVHGVDGLYVADASIMPTITRGNVNLPTAMIGARVAAGLLGLAPADAVRQLETLGEPAR